MNTDDFEKRLQRQPMRQVPCPWRTEVLSAARRAASPGHAPRSALHSPRWFLSTLNSRLSALFWPRPEAWAGLAAAWLFILGLHLAASASAPLANHRPPVAPEALMAFQERARLLQELIGPRDAVEPHKLVPQPRSELQRQLFAAGPSCV